MIYLEEKEDEKWLVFLPRQKSINILCSYTIIKVCTQILLLCTHIGLELCIIYVQRFAGKYAPVHNYVQNHSRNVRRELPLEL